MQFAPDKQIDDATNFMMLLSMPYDNLIQFAASNSASQKIIDNDSFWNTKLLRDYNIVADSNKSAQQQYFERYDLIDSSDENINNIFFEKLVKLEKKSKNSARIYFSGEYDSNQTEFENKSNKLLVGVIARDETFARAVLGLLRIKIDHNKNYIVYMAELIKENNLPLTYANLIKELAEGESHYGDSYSMEEYFTIRYVDGSTLTRNISEIDIWTLPRIENDLEIDLEYMFDD
jgi:hypothetical protein